MVASADNQKMKRRADALKPDNQQARNSDGVNDSHLPLTRIRAGPTGKGTGTGATNDV